MLVDLEFQSQRPVYKLEQDGDDTIVHFSYEGDKHSVLVARRIETGVYQTRTLRNMLNEVTTWELDDSYPGYPYFYFGGLDHLRGTRRDDINLKVRMDALMNSPESYGVADNLNQIRNQCAQYWETDRTFILAYSVVAKEDSPGWRWQKNGSYIGNQEPTQECLGDEPIIQQVLSFEFIEVRPQN